ncbi:MAG: NDP-sugar synthase, partial [Alicyclobacillus sp.]|nr:NDP-sugar synthase [Alicyclobacillus sp.]
MKALLLAGGLGTRLRPLTQTTPKPLVPVVNRPWLEHLLLHLKSQGIQHFVLAVKHEAQQIRAYFQDGRALGVSIQYSEEPDLLGTAGAIRHAAEHTDLGERFVVLNADIVHLVPLLPLLEAHRNAGALVTIGLTEVDDPSAYGVVEQTVTGRIVRFVEKPPRHAAPSKRINAGIYVMEQAVLRSIPVGREVSVERETFPELIRRGGLVQGCLLPGYWMDMGTPERYLQVHADALSGRLPLQIPGFQHSPGIWTGKDVYISKSVTLVPPV